MGWADWSLIGWVIHGATGTCAVQVDVENACGNVFGSETALYTDNPPHFTPDRLIRLTEKTEYR